MKRAFLVLPLLALTFFAIGLAVELSERDDRVEHFEIAPEDELHLTFSEPFFENKLVGTLTGSRGETLEDGILYVDVGEAPFWNRTDAAGRFQLAQLPPGPWRVVVVARGYYPQVFEIQDEGSAQNIVLERPTEDLPELPRLATADLTGKLVDPNIPEAPLAGYEISLLPEAPIEKRSTPFPRRTQTDKNGRFALPALAEGRYRVQVLPSWARGGTWPDLCSDESRELVFDADRGTRELEISIERGEVQGRLTDAKGSFLEGALVLIESAEDERRVWPTVSTTREGSFLLTDLPPGVYRLRARAGAGEAEQQVEVRAGLTLNLDLDPLVTRIDTDETAE